MRGTCEVKVNGYEVTEVRSEVRVTRFGHGRSVREGRGREGNNRYPYAFCLLAQVRVHR